MNYNDLTITQKINKLRELNAKLQIDSEYAMRVNTGFDRDYFIKKVNITIQNAERLFVNGRINDIDIEVRDNVVNEWNNTFNSLLICFPEFYESEEIKR